MHKLCFITSGNYQVTGIKVPELSVCMKYEGVIIVMVEVI